LVVSGMEDWPDAVEKIASPKAITIPPKRSVLSLDHVAALRDQQPEVI
jgi:hypothetical protein